MKKDNVVLEKSFAFAIKVVKLYKYLIENKREYVLSKQFLRSGTAVGALVREAQNAESKADFVHKLAIAQKECDETIYWIELMKDTYFIREKEYNEIHKYAHELLKIIRSIILTTKQNTS